MKDEGTPVPEREDLEKEAREEAERIAAKVGSVWDAPLKHSLAAGIAEHLLAFGKAQRERGRADMRGTFVVPASANVELARLNYLPGKIEVVPNDDTALLREALEALERCAASHNLSAAIVLEKLKARLSPKESGGQGRAGG